MHAVDTPRAVEGANAQRPVKQLATLWAVGTGLAIVLAAGTYLLSERVAGPLVVEGAGHVTLDIVTGMTMFGSTVGAVLAYLAGRFTRRPRMTFLAVSLSALASYAMVPFIAAESISTAVWLNALHVAVAIPVIGMLTWYCLQGVLPHRRQ